MDPSEYHVELAARAHAALDHANTVSRLVVDLDDLDSFDGLGRLESNACIWFDMWHSIAHAFNLVDTLLQTTESHVIYEFNFNIVLNALLDLNNNSHGIVLAGPTCDEIESSFNTVIAFIERHALDRRP